MAINPDLNAVQYFNGRPMYVGRDGQPMSMLAWAEAFADIEGRTVARTTVGGDQVITMWMGLDGDPISSPVPLIFGSIIQDSHGVFSDEIETATEAEALEAHETLVGLIRWRMRGVSDAEPFTSNTPRIPEAEA